VAADDPQTLPIAEVQKRLNSFPDGLSQREAAKRLAKDGPNEIVEKSPFLEVSKLLLWSDPLDDRSRGDFIRGRQALARLLHHPGAVDVQRLRGFLGRTNGRRGMRRVWRTSETISASPISLRDIIGPEGAAFRATHLAVPFANFLRDLSPPAEKIKRVSAQTASESKRSLSPRESSAEPSQVSIGRLLTQGLKELLMSLIHWDPFAEVNTLIRLMPAGSAGFPRLALEGNGARKMEWSPSADISETATEYVIRVDLPAVKKEDVKVTLDQGVLAISGERKRQTDDKNEKFHRVESFYGTFERSFSLPENVNADAVRCDSKDGILTVHIPKLEAQQQKPKHITVQ
jgi:HSP20 family protein